MRLNLKKAKENAPKYISEDGTYDLIIDEVKEITKHDTPIVVLKCLNEEDQIYKKEFSVSSEGLPYFVEFLEDANLYPKTNEELESFSVQSLEGKLFTTTFGKKKNKRYDPSNPKSAKHYVYELPNMVKPYKLEDPKNTKT